MAKSVVRGGAMYLSAMSRAHAFNRSSSCREAASTRSASPASEASTMPLIILLREFRVQGQPNGTVVVVASGQPDRVFHSLGPSGDRDVSLELFGTQHLLEQGSELHFTPRPAHFDVRQHLLEVADSLRKRLHFAQALVDLLEPFADEPERFAEALLEGSLELLIHRRSHLLELRRVVVLDRLETPIHSRPNTLELLLHETDTAVIAPTTSSRSARPSAPTQSRRREFSSRSDRSIRSCARSKPSMRVITGSNLRVEERLRTSGTEENR